MPGREKEYEDFKAQEAQYGAAGAGGPAFVPPPIDAGVGVVDSLHGLDLEGRAFAWLVGHGDWLLCPRLTRGLTRGVKVAARIRSGVSRKAGIRHGLDESG